MLRSKDLSLCCLALALAGPAASALQKRDVTATLADGTTVIGYEAEGLATYQGIPFAQPPVGDLRLKPPQRLNASSLGTIDATQDAAACPQLVANVNATGSLFASVLGYLVGTPFVQNDLLNESEDCLTLNIIAPPDAQPGDDLPVVFWIFGGAFELGWSGLFNGSTYVADSIALDKPIVWVAVNYRVAGFGFMPGKELLAEGSTNLGLRDQRLGLEWVADNIASFGGDPDKVTLYGESAGAISTSLHMTYLAGNNTYNGKPLFRGAIMDSGSVIPYGPIDEPTAQATYDQVVSAGGCSGEADTLACLRGLSYDDFYHAASSVPALFDYNGVQLSYPPRPDGDVIPEPADVLSATGQFAKVPFILGDQEDEGTLFSMAQSNITNTDELVTYLNTFFLPNSSLEMVQGWVDTYPDSQAAGSPYNTGILNDVYPEYKRLAAILGDQLFTLQRRRMLHYNVVNGGAPAYTFLARYFYGTPILGTFHASDLLYGFDEITNPLSDAKQVQHAYYLSFINTLDPNNGTGDEYTVWPQWTEEGREIIIMDNGLQYDVGTDDFREDSYQYLLANISYMRT